MDCGYRSGHKNMSFTNIFWPCRKLNGTCYRLGRKEATSHAQQHVVRKFANRKSVAFSI